MERAVRGFDEGVEVVRLVPEEESRPEESSGGDVPMIRFVDNDVVGESEGGEEEGDGGGTSAQRVGWRRPLGLMKDRKGRGR